MGYEVYAVPEPLAPARKRRQASKSSLWHVGSLRLRAPFVSSGLGDRKLFFRHTLFDDDLRLRPDWRPKVDKHLGAPEYQELIEAGDVGDSARPPCGASAHHNVEVA